MFDTPSISGYLSQVGIALTCMKGWERKWFSEYIRNLILGGNELNVEFLLSNSLSDKVKIKLNMFCPSMEYWIS